MQSGCLSTRTSPRRVAFSSALLRPLASSHPSRGATAPPHRRLPHLRMFHASTITILASSAVIHLELTPCARSKPRVQRASARAPAAGAVAIAIDTSCAPSMASHRLACACERKFNSHSSLQLMFEFVWVADDQYRGFPPARARACSCACARVSLSCSSMRRPLERAIRTSWCRIERAATA